MCLAALTREPLPRHPPLPPPLVISLVIGGFRWTLRYEYVYICANACGCVSLCAQTRVCVCLLAFHGCYTYLYTRSEVCMYWYANVYTYNYTRVYYIYFYTYLKALHKCVEYTPLTA